MTDQPVIKPAGLHYCGFPGNSHEVGTLTRCRCGRWWRMEHSRDGGEWEPVRWWHLRDRRRIAAWEADQ